MFENLGRTIDKLVQAVGTETKATAIEAKSEPISAAYPDAEATLLKLEISVGTVNLTAGGAKLVEGTITYNVAEWTPHVVTENNHVTVKQDVGMHVLGPWHNLHNEWNLALGTAKPFTLNVSKGAGETHMALGGIPLASAQFEMGAGKVQIGFAKPNPTHCAAMKVNMGAGAILLDDLLNANAERFVVAGGAGEVTLNFTGERLMGQTTATLNTGAGKLLINVKHGLPCQVVVKRFLGAVRVHGDFKTVTADTFETPSYHLSADGTLKVEINTPVAEIVLNEVD